VSDIFAAALADSVGRRKDITHKAAEYLRIVRDFQQDAALKASRTI
jgi:hypothetical protein